MMRRLIRFLLGPRGQALERLLVRASGRSLLNAVMASREGFKPQPMLLLVTLGRKSGALREAVLPYFTFGDAIVVVGSKGGAPDDPAWVTNLRHDPKAEISVARKRRRVSGRIARGAERAALWGKVTAGMAVYHKYQARTEREIPVVVFEPRG